MNRLLAALLICMSGISAFCGEIADYHLKHYSAPSTYTRQSSDTHPTNHGISEIGIERTACYGKCPVYTFIVKSDGTFRYKGVENVQRVGEFTGTIPVYEFRRLAQFISDCDYMNLYDNYRASVTDNATVYTLVVAKEKRKTIQNYANAGPTTLWAIEQLIDDLQLKAKWDEPKKK